MLCQIFYPKEKCLKLVQKSNKKQQGELKSYYKMQQPAKGKKRWTGSYGQIPSPLPLPEEKDDSPFKGGDTKKVSNPKANVTNQAKKLAVKAMKKFRDNSEALKWAASETGRSDPGAERLSAINAQFRKDKAEASKKRKAESRKKKSLTEVSKQLVSNYIKAASKDVIDLASSSRGGPYGGKYPLKKIINREKGIELATDKLSGELSINKAKVPAYPTILNKMLAKRK